MNANILEAARTTGSTPLIPVTHIIKGEVVEGDDISFGQSGGMQFATPKLDIDTLVWPRREAGAAFDVPVDEIIDLLVATGERLRADPDGYLAQALDNVARTCTLERRIVENTYHDVPQMFTDRSTMEFMIEQELGGKDVLDGWRSVTRPHGQTVRIRAFPPRLIHILAGNVPSVAAGTIIQASLTKGLHLLKMPSNDLFTAPAILRTMAAVAPDHPVVRSFSAVYWRGGDAEVESRICRPQYFDKIVAWGGEQAIRSIKQYTGPGLDLVTFDPKTSISLIGREAFASEAALEEAAELAAIDATHYNQGACIASRFQFVEGTTAEIDWFSERLQHNLTKARRTTSELCGRIGGEVRDEIAALREMEPEYRAWGGYDGAGLVIRSDEPVDFHPDGKIVNVVGVEALQDAVRFATVATATVGVFPFDRRAELRDSLACAGVQRVVDLGQAMNGGFGAPHDGFWALNRYMRWVTDEG